MPESENALWAKTRRRNMAAPRRRTERSESAAERACKAPRPTDSRRTFTPRRRNCAQSKYVRIVGTKKEQQKRCPTAHIAFRAQRTPCRAAFCSPLLRTAGRKKAHPPGALFLKGHHKFALWNDTIALRLKNRVAPLFGGGASKSVGGAKNGFIMRFFAFQLFCKAFSKFS